MFFRVREVDDVLPGKTKGVSKQKRRRKKKKQKKKKIPQTTEIVGSFRATASSVEDILGLFAVATENRTKSGKPFLSSL